MPRTPAEKAAGLLIVRLGNNLPPAVTASEQEDSVAALLDRHPIGGLILFNGQWPQTRDTLTRLQARSDRGLLVTTDMERGFGQQVAGGTVYPHAAAFARADDPAGAVRTFARQASEEALACGVHVTYSPVADVDRNEANPIIASRAFSDDPAEAAALAAAFVEGVHEAGQFATAKHFPGHGATSGDSHAELPTVDDDRATLEATDFVPFRATIDAGVDLVMTAHVVYPALDPDRPATRSRAVLHDLLREDMGFGGVVVTDSLQMAGAKAEGQTEAEVAVDLLQAGVDLFVDAVDPEAIIAGLAGAVEAGRLDEALLDAALARADRLRQRFRARFGADAFRTPPLPPETVAAPAHAQTAAEVAREAVEVARDPLPDLGDGTGTLVVFVKRAPLPNEPETMPLGVAVAEHLPGAVYRELEPAVEDDDDAFDAVRLLAREADRLVIATVARPAAWHRFGLAARERRFVQSLTEGHPTTFVVLGDARGLRGYDACEAALVAYSDVPASQVAVVERLAGR